MSDPKDEAKARILAAISGLPVGVVIVLCDQGEVEHLASCSNIKHLETIIFLLESALERFKGIESGGMLG